MGEDLLIRSRAGAVPRWLAQLCLGLGCCAAQAVSPHLPVNVLTGYRVDPKSTLGLGSIVLLRACKDRAGNDCDFPIVLTGTEPKAERGTDHAADKPLCHRLGAWTDGEDPKGLDKVLAPGVAQAARTFWKLPPAQAVWPAVRSIGLTYADLLDGYAAGPIAATFLLESKGPSTMATAGLLRVPPKDAEELFRAAGTSCHPDDFRFPIRFE